MNKNNQTNKIILGFILNSCCLLTGQAAQAQSIEHNRLPISAKALAREAEAGQLGRDAAIDLHAGNYVRAEDEARQSEALDVLAGVSQEVLAAALDAQGKDQEAIQEYRAMAIGGQPRNLLPYAELLLKSGQWAQAVAVYNQALPRLGHEELEQITSHFLPDVPEPTGLAIAIHLERGRLFSGTTSWGGETQNTEAMTEYAKALQLAPDNALANYYYGVGWHKLSPAERVKFGHADQAKAALQKAAQAGDASVKKMAEAMLKKSN
jgi:tetratricopeptide (TPR) repeat protein